MNKARELVLGLAFLILLLLTIYTPFGMVTIYLIPLPFIIYGYNHTWGNSIAAVALGSIVALFFGEFYGFSITVMTGSVGIIMGNLYRKDTPLNSFVAGVISTIAFLIVGLVVTRVVFQIDVVDQFKQMLLDVAHSPDLVQLGVSQGQVEQMAKTYESFVRDIDMLLPFLFITYALFSTSLNHLFAKIAVKFIGGSIPSFPPVRDWMLPKSILYYYIASFIILFVDPLYEIYTLRLIVGNLIPLLQLFLTIQGIAFVFYVTYYKKWGRIVPTLTIVGVFVLPFLSQILNLVGMLDLGLDLRNRLNNRG